MLKLPAVFKATSIALLSLTWLVCPAYSQSLTGGVSTDVNSGYNYGGYGGYNGGTGGCGYYQQDNPCGITTSGIVGPVGLPCSTSSDSYLFTLPNFQGDTREQDLYYYLHPYNYQAWDTYRNLMYDYAANARQQMRHGWPPPPYSVYDYAGNIATGTGLPINPPAGCTGTIVPGSSGVSVNPNGGAITNKPSTAGEDSGLGVAVTNLQGQLIQPPTVDPPPATMEPLHPLGMTPGWTGR